MEIGNDSVRIALVVTDNCDDIETAMDDARFIVEACNAYDTLRAENEKLREVLATARMRIRCLPINLNTPNLYARSMDAIKEIDEALDRAALKGGE